MLSWIYNIFLYFFRIAHLFLLTFIVKQFLFNLGLASHRPCWHTYDPNLYCLWTTVPFKHWLNLFSMCLCLCFRWKHRKSATSRRHAASNTWPEWHLATRRSSSPWQLSCQPVDKWARSPCQFRSKDYFHKRQTIGQCILEMGDVRIYFEVESGTLFRILKSWIFPQIPRSSGKWSIV